MTISAKIICDSISPQGKRITTLQLRYNKFIHGEFLTHRKFSRSSSSSRAIPVERMIADVMDDPAMPVHWGKNQKGMQADEEFDETSIEILKAFWLQSRDEAVNNARALMDVGVHKQVANRIMEPFLHINTLVTATDFDNFFNLRCHKDAQPEIKVLADLMYEEMYKSGPVLLQPGQWHVPYFGTVEDVRAMSLLPTEEQQAFSCKISTARCARVSYLTQDGKTPTIAADLALYDRLVGSVPLHASPAEHQATPDTPEYEYSNSGFRCDPTGGWDNPEQHGNFVGWRQYRRTLEGGIV